MISIYFIYDPGFWPDLTNVTCGDGWVEGLMVVTGGEEDEMGTACSDGFDTLA